MQLTVRAIDQSLREDFYKVHCERNGEGWCNCVAWWTPSWEGWGNRSAKENQKLRDDLFDQGQYDGFLLYGDDRPVAWCQCGLRDRLLKLCGQYHLDPDPTVWAVTCFVMTPPLRGTGLTHRFLEEILRQLKNRGVTRVQAFPKRGEGLETGEVWTGPEALFKKAGFRVEREDPKFPVYTKNLNE